MPTISELQMKIVELESEVDRLRLKASNLTAERDRAQEAERRAVVGRRLAEAAKAAGVLPAAVSDVEHRGLNEGDWRPDGKGSLVLHDANGLAVYDGAGRPVTDKSWAAGLRQSAPYFFAPTDAAPAASPSTLGRAPASGQTRPNGEQNPFDHRSGAFNLTAQGKIVREDPAKAKALMQAAGWAPQKVSEFFGEPRPHPVFG